MEEPELELYTIPAQSSWFVWDDIHEIERREFEEFFTESSITRTPKVYKEYRDFIINKYREDTTRKLTFTSIRKHLVGDVNLLRKVFQFLENWGLINFTPKKPDDDDENESKDNNAKIEESIPIGIRVIATPNSFRPITIPPVIEEGAESGFKSPPLTSFSNVFINSKKKKPVDDDEDECCDVDWSEEEILVLLESVLKHGDDWELIAQSVSNKSKSDCISKLIELPFGEFLMSSSSGRLNETNSKTEETKTIDEEEEEEEEEEDEPQAKRKCLGLVSDNGSSMMKQVLTMVSKVGSDVTTAATKAAVSALCDEASFPKEIFDTKRDNGDNEQEEKDLPVALRIRASLATALGAAAANAKILADQEEREMEVLAATVIDQQLKKLQSKLKFLDDLEVIMDKEERLIDGLKETIVEERISVLESAFRSGITKRWDHTNVK